MELLGKATAKARMAMIAPQWVVEFCLMLQVPLACSDHSSTTTSVQGCFIAGLLMTRTVFLSGDTSRMTPACASEISVLPSGNRTKPLGQFSF
jgi:hypothetical protein